MSLRGFSRSNPKSTTKRKGASKACRVGKMQIKVKSNTPKQCAHHTGYGLLHKWDKRQKQNKCQNVKNIK